MRYTCKNCGKWVKDKFIFGTMHICLTEDEIREQLRQRNSATAQVAQQREIARKSNQSISGQYPREEK